MKISNLYKAYNFKRLADDKIVNEYIMAIKELDRLRKRQSFLFEKSKKLEKEYSDLENSLRNDSRMGPYDNSNSWDELNRIGEELDLVRGELITVGADFSQARLNSYIALDNLKNLPGGYTAAIPDSLVQFYKDSFDDFIGTVTAIKASGRIVLTFNYGDYHINVMFEPLHSDIMLPEVDFQVHFTWHDNKIFDLGGMRKKFTKKFTGSQTFSPEVINHIEDSLHYISSKLEENLYKDSNKLYKAHRFKRLANEDLINDYIAAVREEQRIVSERDALADKYNALKDRDLKSGPSNPNDYFAEGEFAPILSEEAKNVLDEFNKKRSERIKIQIKIHDIYRKILELPGGAAGAIPESIIQFYKNSFEDFEVEPTVIRHQENYILITFQYPKYRIGVIIQPYDSHLLIPGVKFVVKFYYKYNNPGGAPILNEYNKVFDSSQTFSPEVIQHIEDSIYYINTSLEQLEGE